MENKKIVIFFVIALLMASPVVVADNFLTGYNVFDVVGDFFNNLFSKVVKGGFQTGGEHGGEIRRCVENDIKCGNSNDCLGFYPCVMKCQNNNWEINDICEGDTPLCENGECIESPFYETQEGQLTEEIICEEGEKRCGGNYNVLICLNNQWQGHATCTDPYLCEEGECVEQSEDECGDGIDNDRDGLIDCEDVEDCEGEEFDNFYCGEDGKEHESSCEDGADNDGDELVDNLDPDCRNANNRLSITGIETIDDNFYQYSKIPIVDCAYAITPTVSSQYVKLCMNLTYEGKDMDCEEVTSTQGVIKFRKCDVGEEIGENKEIICSIPNKCNGEYNTRTKLIEVKEFSICEDDEVNPEYLGNLRIIEPDNNDEFEIGEIIDIEIKAENYYQNEDGERTDIDIIVEASLVDTEKWEEVETVTSTAKEVSPLEDETFELSLTIPEDLDGNYRLFAKAYKSRDEDEVCKDVSINIDVAESDDEGCIDEDDDGYCEEDDCDDEDETIFPTAIEICNDDIDNNCDGLIDFADSDCITSNEGGGRTYYDEDETDSDGDGLPDSWEYNWFGSLTQGPQDDLDGDGVSNIDEYRFNTNPKIKEKTGSSSLWTILFIILGVVVIVGIIMFFVLRGKKSSRSSGYTLSENNKNKIKSFVEDSKAQGMKKQEIRNALLNAGWRKQDIDRFL